MDLDVKFKLEDLVKSPNIAEMLDEQDLITIGSTCYSGFEADLQSRSAWEKRTEESLKLALQVAESKSFPWPNASNIKFPLITVAALQYHARAYPALIQGDTPVKCNVTGNDPDGKRYDRAMRIQNHMSWQILEQDENWEEEFDRVLITQPIVGTAFKKTYYDVSKGHNVSENILAKDLVVNYWTKDLDTAPRITQVLYMSRNDIHERVTRGLWLEMGLERPNAPVAGALDLAKNKAQGMDAPQSVDPTTPFEILEQHCWIDLDGDGYQEPYIVYLHKDSRKVCRIVARFFTQSIKKDKDGNVLNIKPEAYFTKFPFIPSPDGGFYDLGFGVLLGPLNESINSIINQLVDAGTMANTAGGFLSRGIKLRGGNYNFAPLEWKHVDTTGDDLRKGIVPLPVREPSNVLFTLLSLLINYGERIGGSVDILVGQNPGQNTPAETSRTMAEQGMKIFSGIFKRTYRSLKSEFRKLYRLNQLYLQQSVEFGSGGLSNFVQPDDYSLDATAIAPMADPNIISDSQRMMQAQAMLQLATTTPGVNIHEAQVRYAKALKVPDIEMLLPDPKGPNAIPPQPNPKLQIEQLKAQVQHANAELKFKLGLMKLMKDAELNQSKIRKMEAEAVKNIADAQGVNTGHQVALMNAEIAAAKHKQDGLLSAIETMMKLNESQQEAGQQQGEQPEEGAPPMQ